MFAKVTEGLELLNIINETLLKENKSPCEDIYIEEVKILYDPFKEFKIGKINKNNES